MRTSNQIIRNEHLKQSSDIPYSHPSPTESCLSGAAEPRRRSALKHQIHLISIHLISSFLVLPEHTWVTHSQSKNPTTELQTGARGGWELQESHQVLPLKGYWKNPVSCTESSIFLTHFSLGYYLQLSWSLVRMVVPGRSQLLSKSSWKWRQVAGWAEGRARERQQQDLLWSWIILYFSANTKHLYKAQSRNGELFSGQALVTRGFLLGAETPPHSSIPEDALRSCLLLEVTEIQAL